VRCSPGGVRIPGSAVSTHTSRATLGSGAARSSTSTLRADGTPNGRPGYEYHYLDDEQDPPEIFSQIPDGFAGATHPRDDTRADASRWLDRLPVIREFRRRLLER